MSDHLLHRGLRKLAAWATITFYTEIHVIGGEHVPKEGPLIACATHHNMMMDPAVLSTAFPHKRIMNYWSKAQLFANPVMSYILYSSGNIPVDRKNKDRSLLFKGTIDALAKSYSVALFPEGTSYTEPRIMQVKDGAAWASLEYTKWARANPEKADPRRLVVVPVAIVYTNKSKYRSDVIVEFGHPIQTDDYMDQFMSGGEGEAKLAVKRLTKAIERGLIEGTINSPDWDTMYAARMARDLLWEEDRSINLDDFVVISQTLVDLFSTKDATSNFVSVRRHLLDYYSLLQTSKLSNSVLATLPLPRSLDPNKHTPLPSRLLTLCSLVFYSLSSLIRLPLFIVPLFVHMPMYMFSRLGAKLAEEEEETQAQNKVVFGLLFLMMVYPLTFWMVWAFLGRTMLSALAGAFVIYMFASYHNKLINDNYQHAKRFTAAWRVLVGVWVPKKWDLSMDALSQYTTPLIPKENEWIDKPKKMTEILHPTQTEPPVKARPKRRPPTRRIMRHILRARAEAIRALASFFDKLETAPQGHTVKASAHLARAYGGVVETAVGEDEDAEEIAWRESREVVAFLRQRGAKIGSLRSGIRVEGDWAALSSEGEAEDSDVGDEDVVWVQPTN